MIKKPFSFALPQYPNSDGQTSDSIPKFYADLVRLKRLYRQGWLKRGLPGELVETVAEHSFGVAMLALLLYPPGLDALKVLRMALLHDLGEIHAGDIILVEGSPHNTLSREEKQTRERESLHQTLSALPDGERWLALWDDFENGTSPEAAFVRQLDRLEMGLQAWIYEAEFPHDLGEFYTSVDQALADPELRKILDFLVRTRPNSTSRLRSPSLSAEEPQAESRPGSWGGLAMVHDRAELHHFFSRNPGIYLYQLGDLEPGQWERSTWYGWRESGRLLAVALLYSGFDPPVFIAIGPKDSSDPLVNLVQKVRFLLPNNVYAHLSPFILPLFAGSASVSSPPFGSNNPATLPARHYMPAPILHYRMILDRQAFQEFLDTHPKTSVPALVKTLTEDDIPALLDFYNPVPDMPFHLAMLATGHWKGAWQNGQLASVSGLHVFSTATGVAALGNIFTHPDYRRRGLARQVIASQLKEILPVVNTIGLNVRSDNLPAIRLYQELGFKTVMQFYEGIIISG